MPEAPDVDAHIAALETRVVGEPLEALRGGALDSARPRRLSAPSRSRLADRALFRLLTSDWPRTLDELEARKALRGDEKRSP